MEVLATRSSNHKPLWISFDSTRLYRRGPRSFKYEACWNLDEESLEVVREAWGAHMEAESEIAVTLLKLDSAKGLY
jgi:hypothetical protein